MYNEYNITSEDQYLGWKDRPFLIGNKPNSVFLLAIISIKKNLQAIFAGMGLERMMKYPAKHQQFPMILHLTLSNSAVSLREREREAAGHRVPAHPLSRGLYSLGCLFLDGCFDGRPIERFWFLETVARIPYFSYVSMLHLYESLGWWREPTLRKVHTSQDWNELNHLLVMETLGGDRAWLDRFLGYHCAVLYYWLVALAYCLSPAIAYEFMELLEAHAVDTYSVFLEDNEAALRALPAPQVAVDYYSGSDLYEFDDFQVSRSPGTRRPRCDSLFDVFCNIRDDEIEHVDTMKACQNYAKGGAAITSPHDRDRVWGPETDKE
jgi:ubiquinol oxidase